MIILGPILIVFGLISLAWVTKTLSSCYSDGIEHVITIAMIISFFSLLSGFIIIGYDGLQLLGII